eukprot:3023470-Amphidinium_carterae.1
MVLDASNEWWALAAGTTCANFMQGTLHTCWGTAANTVSLARSFKLDLVIFMRMDLSSCMSVVFETVLLQGSKGFNAENDHERQIAEPPLCNEEPTPFTMLGHFNIKSHRDVRSMLSGLRRLQRCAWTHRTTEATH